MNTRLSSSFKKHAWLSLVLGLSCALVACDKVTHVSIEIEAPANIDPTCVDAAAQYVDATQKFARAREEDGAVGFSVRRGSASVGITVYQRTITMNFGWFGNESEEVERASLMLLDDVRRAVIRSCDIQRPPARITRRCAISGCDELLKED
jgi:hypothetical protein